MARPEVTGKKIGPAETGDFDAYSIEEFCRRHSISVPFYYKLRDKNPPETPREFELGARVLISREAAADWRREREAATAARERVAAAEQKARGTVRARQPHDAAAEDAAT
jgi:hypothetical protein